MKEVPLRISVVRSSKNSIGFAQTWPPTNVNVIIVNQNSWKTVWTGCKKTDFPEPVNCDFDFENQNNQIN